jgi:hypothetical protein
VPWLEAKAVRRQVLPETVEIDDHLKKLGGHARQAPPIRPQGSRIGVDQALVDTREIHDAERRADVVEKALGAVKPR